MQPESLSAEVVTRLSGFLSARSILNLAHMFPSFKPLANAIKAVLLELNYPTRCTDLSQLWPVFHFPIILDNDDSLSSAPAFMSAESIAAVKHLLTFMSHCPGAAAAFHTFSVSYLHFISPALPHVVYVEILSFDPDEYNRDAPALVLLELAKLSSIIVACLVFPKDSSDSCSWWMNGDDLRLALEMLTFHKLLFWGTIPDSMLFLENEYEVNTIDSPILKSNNLIELHVDQLSLRNCLIMCKVLRTQKYQNLTELTIGNIIEPILFEELTLAVVKSAVIRMILEFPRLFRDPSHVFAMKKSIMFENMISQLVHSPEIIELIILTGMRNSVSMVLQNLPTNPSFLISKVETCANFLALFEEFQLQRIQWLGYEQILQLQWFR
ncbi:hypothetical protein HK100_010152 [Physocladia obscura]|uniref:Uncharacterized protein n=1 Tax=Physocladia obscura TaxID=109957 RepID=A0AAD5T8P2_9FUNG|nr:hypothetical protein HK100_010152 [Physocladia obscura]